MKKINIKPGDVFTSWTVLTYPNRALVNPVVSCQCKCGTIRDVGIYALTSGRSKSCGCMSREKKAHIPKDYGISKGDKIGYWKVIKQNGSMFYCECICGKRRNINVSRLLNGKSRSCGCRRFETRERVKVDESLQKGRDLMHKLRQSGTSLGYVEYRKVNSNSTTKVNGVSLMKNGKYRAYIFVDRKQINLGCYQNIDDASVARKAAENKYFSDRAKLARKIIKEYRTGVDVPQNHKRYQRYDYDALIGKPIKGSHLTILKIEGAMAYCHCDLCGNDKWIRKSFVVTKNNRSCGCARINALKNGLNNRKVKTNTSGTVGVTYCKKDKCYMAFINIKKVNFKIGNFRSKDDAAAARKAAERSYLDLPYEELLAARDELREKKKLLRRTYGSDMQYHILETIEGRQN